MHAKQMTAKDFAAGMGQTVKITVKDVINSLEHLRTLAHQTYPVMLSYKISKSLKKLDVIVDTFNTERKEILSRLGKEDATGKFTYEGENEKVAEKEVGALLDKEVEIEVFKLTLSELAPYQLEARLLAMLDWYISEE